MREIATNRRLPPSRAELRFHPRGVVVLERARKVLGKLRRNRPPGLEAELRLEERMFF